MSFGHYKVVLYEFQPVNIDIWDRRENHPEPGTICRLVQPVGCPKNGTMDHVFAEPVEGGSLFLCHKNSLTKVRK